MGLHENLNWRYATKKMNGKKVPDEKVEYILEAARLAPTSSGLQPFQIIVVSNQELKEKMKPIAFNQSQITDSSHVLVFAAWDKYTPERINETFANIISQRGLKENAMDDFVRLYEEWGTLFLAGAAFSPIPYKVATIASGAANMDLTTFITVSSIGRAARFFLVAGLLFKYGATIKAFIEKYFDILSIAFLVLLVGGFVAIKYLL